VLAGQPAGWPTKHDYNQVNPIMTQTQTRFFRVVFEPGSRVVSKIANPRNSHMRLKAMEKLDTYAFRSKGNPMKAPQISLTNCYRYQIL
jgi:hypothetical protein